MRAFRSDRPRGARGNSRSRLLLPFVVFLSAAMPGSAGAQERDIVSKAITVGPTEASLRLEFEDGILDVSVADGIVEIGGEEVGRLGPDDRLDRAWRQLLGSAVNLDGNALARALVEWTPPADLPRTEDAELGQRIDSTLESALVSSALFDSGREAAERSERLIGALLSRSDRLSELSEALEGVDLDNVQVWIGEDVFISRETDLDGSLLAVDSDVEIEGTVRGDVIVVDGTLALSGGARVTGDVRLADSRLLADEGTVEGLLSEVPAPDNETGSRASEDEEDGDDVRAILDRAEALAQNDGPDLLRPVRAIGRGLAGLVATVVNVVCLALLGWLVVYLAGDNLAVVAETARRSTGRSVVVGLAATFLILPVWVLGALALVITIVGIFALPFWLVLFPIAVAAAAGFGFYGVASGIGEQLSRWRHPMVDWIRPSNGFTLVAGGLIALAAPFALSNLAKIAVFLGPLEVMLFIAGCLAVSAAGLVGLGAVLLTRGGRQPEFDWPGTTNGDPDDGPRPGSGPSGGASTSGGADWFGTDRGEARSQPPDPSVTE